MTLRAQGMIGTDGRRGGVPGMLRQLGGVQLDTISVLARSHELVAYARLGAIPRSRIERAYWGPGQPGAFEYWSHAACVLPIEEWPYYEFRRRALRARGLRWHQSHARVCAEVLARIRAEGPLTATQLGGAKNGGAWWDWSDTKIAVEWLLDVGDVICSRRTGWRRVYDLPERVLSDALLGARPSDDECVIRMVSVAARALGVVTRSDLVDYQRLQHFSHGPLKNAAAASDVAIAAGLTPVMIGSDGTAIPGWADPAALDLACRRTARCEPGPPPGHAAVTVRLPHLGPEAHAADVRLRAQPGGIRAQAKARARILHHAAARQGPAARPGGPGPQRTDADRPPAVAGYADGRRADGKGASRGRRVGWLRRRAA